MSWFEDLFINEAEAALDSKCRCTGSGGNAGSNGGFVAQDIPPEDTSLLWIDTDDDIDDGFQEAVNTALAQAKASGEFDGISVTGATVGQTVQVAEVDENGAPTAWIPVDFPSGGDLSTETWTFQLADGSVVTKEVYVK